MTKALSRAETIERLCRIAAEQVGADPAQVHESTHFVNDLDFDSLDQVEFIMNVEDQFETSIPDELAEKANTVGEAADLLVREQPASA